MEIANSTMEYVSNLGMWGPVTATLDWCEMNYQFSYYIAEMANTWSNLATVFLALFGAWQTYRQRLPTRFLLGWLGFGVVGLGSFLFHMTLLYEAQLADELPMIYVGSYSCFVLFDTATGFISPMNKKSKNLGTFFTAFNILFTLAYAIYRNPVFHQVVFATLMLTVLFRTEYLMRSSAIPEAMLKQLKTVFRGGAVTFVAGFVIWNLDNIFCLDLTGWKFAITWPAAFLLEGHAWWHVLTAAGTYFLLVGTSVLTLAVKDSPKNYRLGTFAGIPIVERVTQLHEKQL